MFQHPRYVFNGVTLRDIDKYKDKNLITLKVKSRLSMYLHLQKMSSQSKR